MNAKVKKTLFTSSTYYCLYDTTFCDHSICKKPLFK